MCQPEDCDRIVFSLINNWQKMLGRKTSQLNCKTSGWKSIEMAGYHLATHQKKTKTIHQQQDLCPNGSIWKMCDIIVCTFSLTKWCFLANFTFIFQVSVRLLSPRPQPNRNLFEQLVEEGRNKVLKEVTRNIPEKTVDEQNLFTQLVNEGKKKTESDYSSTQINVKLFVSAISLLNKWSRRNICEEFIWVWFHLCCTTFLTFITILFTPY